MNLKNKLQNSARLGKGLLALAVVGKAATADALTITPVWDSTITSNPNAAAIMSTINSAIAVYQSSFSDPITVSINFASMNSGLGQSSTYYSTVSYTSYRNALVADATTANDATALAHLPVQANNPVNGSANIAVTTANLRALGFSSSPPSGQPDSFIGLNTSLMNLDRITINPSKYDLFAVVSHEIDESLGMGTALNGLANGAATPTGSIWGEDLYRYDALGNRSFNTTQATQSYFSIDGATLLARFNQTAGGDFSDFYSTGAHTPEIQDAFGTPGAIPNFGVEPVILDVLGYNLVPEPGSLSLIAMGGLASLLFRSKRK